MKEVLINLSLNYFLVQFVVSTLSITSLTLFFAQSIAFCGSKNLHWTRISSPYLAHRFIHFPTTLHLMTQFGRVRKNLNVLLKIFEIRPPVYPPIISATVYLSFSFPSSHFKCKLNNQMKIAFSFLNNQNNFHLNIFEQKSLHKKWNFPLRKSSVNVTKSTVSYVFDHIYWRNP